MEGAHGKGRQKKMKEGMSEMDRKCKVTRRKWKGIRRCRWSGMKTGIEMETVKEDGREGMVED